MKNLLNRIDGIVDEFGCPYSSKNIYKEKLFEIRQIILSTVGKESDLFQSFLEITKAKIDCWDAIKYLEGLLKGLKAHLQLQMNTNKRYQVFISSTYLDLINYRKVVSDEISFLGHIPAGMEDFTACGENLETYIKQIIDESDYYVLIIGQRFGSSIARDENVSYTMMEYEYATSKGMRIIPLIYNGEHDLAGNDLAVNKNKFDKFVSQVVKTVPQYFKDENELIRKLTKALDAEIKNHPQKGWIRL